MYKLCISKNCEIYYIELTIIKSPFQKFSNSNYLEIFEMHNLYIMRLYDLQFITCKIVSFCLWCYFSCIELAIHCHLIELLFDRVLASVCMLFFPGSLDELKTHHLCKLISIQMSKHMYHLAVKVQQISCHVNSMQQILLL